MNSKLPTKLLGEEISHTSETTEAFKLMKWTNSLLERGCKNIRNVDTLGTTHNGSRIMYGLLGGLRLLVEDLASLPRGLDSKRLGFPGHLASTAAERDRFSRDRAGGGRSIHSSARRHWWSAGKRRDEALVAFLARRHPLVEPLQLQQAAVRGVVPPHGEERSDETFALRG